MKRILCSVFALCALVFTSCGSFISDVKEAEESVRENAAATKIKKLTVSNLAFDSLTYELSADVTADDGTKLTLTCLNEELTAVAGGGKISLVLDTPFSTGAKGGKDYTVQFSADGYAGTSATISYWPFLRMNVLTADEITIYNGGAGDYEPPIVQLVNYDEENVTYKNWFKIFTTESYGTESQEEITGVDTSSWTLDTFREWLTASANDGKTIEAHYSVTPNCDGGENLKNEGYIVYHCKKDVLVKSVRVSNQWGRFEAHLYADEDQSDASEAETAGGIVSYQWQGSQDETVWTDIPDASKKTFSLTKENADALIDKLIRVKITQNFEGTEQPSLVSPASIRIYHKPVQTALYYDGLLPVGSRFDTTKIRGTITDECGNDYGVNDFSWILISEFDENDYYTAVHSENYWVQFLNDSFYDSVAEVFATVQAVFAEDELPLLSTDTASIPAGSVLFASVDKRLELSYDGGATYSDFPEETFFAKIGATLYLRKKAVGTPNQSGYIKESESRTITVKEENIGRKASGGGLINGLQSLSFSLKKSSTTEETVLPQSDVFSTKKTVVSTTFTPAFSYVDSAWEYEYEWLIDGVNALSYEGVSVDSATNALVVQHASFANDVYQVFCKVHVFVTIDAEQGLSIDVATLSSQSSLTVNNAEGLLIALSLSQTANALYDAGNSSVFADISLSPVLSVVSDSWRYEYAWTIDGTDALSLSGVSADDASHVLSLKRSFSEGSHAVSCTVRIYDANGNSISRSSSTAIVLSSEGLEPLLSLRKSTAVSLALDDSTVFLGMSVTPAFTYAENGLHYEYTWLIDGKDALSFAGAEIAASAEASPTLSVYNSFANGAHSVSCTVRIYDNAGERAIASAQTAFTVNAADSERFSLTTKTEFFWSEAARFGFTVTSHPNLALGGTVRSTYDWLFDGKDLSELAGKVSKIINNADSITVKYYAGTTAKKHPVSCTMTLYYGDVKIAETSAKTTVTVQF